jgi:hypothetical protein
MWVENEIVAKRLPGDYESRAGLLRGKVSDLPEKISRYYPYGEPGNPSHQSWRLSNSVADPHKSR